MKFLKDFVVLHESCCEDLLVDLLECINCAKLKVFLIDIVVLLEQGGALGEEEQGDEYMDDKEADEGD